MHGQEMTVKAVIFIALFALCQGTKEMSIKNTDDAPTYNHTLATTIVQYASAVYITDLTALFTWTCSRCNDLIKDFEITELVVDVPNCLQAFVGVADDLNSIIIAFRGTQEESIRNWVEDLFWKQLDLHYPGVEDAMVHHGFYAAYHNTSLRNGILCAVQRTREFYGDIPVIVTGHSMGGALASFCALDLSVNQGVRSIQLWTFGQPRIGNAVFASYFKNHVPHTFRVTNENDIVPHFPPYYSYFPKKTYHHFPREVWLRKAEPGKFFDVDEKICDDSGEDPTCSRSVYGNSISDHLKYYDVDLMADSWGSCNVMMDNIILQYGLYDGKSIILSRELVTPSVLQLPSDAGIRNNSA